MRTSFFSFLLPFIAILQLALSGPVVRELPSIPDSAQIAKDFKAPPSDKSLFFTGGYTNAQITDLEKWASTAGLTMLGNCFPNNYLDKTKYKQVDDFETKWYAFLKAVSREYAEGSKGNAYLIVNGDKFPTTTGIFYSVEFPAIKDKGVVPEIRQVKDSSRPSDPTKTYTSWWKKGQADPKPPAQAPTTTTTTRAASTPTPTHSTTTSSSPPAVVTPSPTPTPPPAADTCGDWYHVLYDSFQIYGKNFDPAKLGDNGQNLHNNLQHCGAITAWSFQVLTNDPNGYQWKATGNQPIGTKSCVGGELTSSGGNTADGCTGAG